MNPSDIETLDDLIKKIEARKARLFQILRSGCRCLMNATTGESTECEVCKKARENIQ